MREPPVTGDDGLKNLVIICAGDHSLHTSWEKKNYELWVIYYGTDEKKSEIYRKTADRFFERKGLKCDLLRQVCFYECQLQENINFSVYDFVWMPDDDLQFLQGDSPEKLLKICAELEADVFQPAIDNDYISKCWEPTKKINGAYAHRTNIVEIMAFGFSGKVFKECFLTALHACEFVESGWGIEPIFKNIGESLYGRYLNTFVIDACPIVHTRPVGSGEGIIHSKGVFEARHFPQIEAQRMKTLKVYNSLEDVQVDTDNYMVVDSGELRKDFYKISFRDWYEHRRIERRVRTLLRRIARKVSSTFF